jgi:hypothetical protein
MMNRTIGRAADLGIDTEPDQPWVTVCEAHGTFISSATRRLARATVPVEFCGDCQEEEQRQI